MYIGEDLFFFFLIINKISLAPKMVPKSGPQAQKVAHEEINKQK